MAKDYKDTLNLPQTGFPMKANLAQREPEMLRNWEEKGIYQKMQECRRSSGARYILHDGPPYANGHIHMGHALNKILKDIIVKYKTMKGLYSPYVPGWDCHGLPIELQVDKNLGDRKDKIDIIEKRRLCREYAAQFVDIQREEFERLGVFGDWKRPYLTMTYDYESSIVAEFFKFVKGGYVYKGKKPVHWCPSCVTALAEAEVEYADKESPSVFVKFAVDEESLAKFLPGLGGRKVFVVIWTTTPWTLPANLAVAFHPELRYAALEQGDEVLIVAEGRIEALRERIGLRGEVMQAKQGKELEGMLVNHPFLGRKSRAVLGEFVSLEEGTGIVHIAPGHGEDDYEVGLKYGLDIYAPVDDRGKFTKQAGELEGQFVFKANQVIIGMLKERNALIREEKITHSYPHCWRCKKPVIFRATEQWFISVEFNDLRKKCLEEIDKIAKDGGWIPSWGRERIYGMVGNRPDWCISRQRSWGVPIMMIRCKECGEFVHDETVFDEIVRLVEAHGADVWYEKEASDILPAGYTCKKCGKSDFRKEMDILDVWFDSGVSHAAVVERDQRLSWPADMYLEGSDQHRGWFQSSLLASVGTRGRAPYETVLTHGFVVDGSGKKMSKSLGNVIAPQEIIKGFGAEILRLWVAAEDYRDDIRVSKEILNRLTEAYRKIRNTARFLLGNTNDFDHKDYSGNLQEIDKWAMSRLQQLVASTSEAYDNFDFHRVYYILYNFCVNDMSSLYLDVLKDRLYTFRADSGERRAAQWVLYNILRTMTKLMAPIMSFTAEEIWGFLEDAGKESVFLSEFPAVDEDVLDKKLEARFMTLKDLRDIVNQALELKRAEKFIGSPLDARITLYMDPGFYDEFYKRHGYDFRKHYGDFFATLFIVSQVEVTDTAPHGAYEDGYVGIYAEDDVSQPGFVKGYLGTRYNVSVLVEKAQGAKCQRCWNWSEKVGAFNDEPELCERCYPVIKTSA